MEKTEPYKYMTRREQMKLSITDTELFNVYKQRSLCHKCPCWKFCTSHIDMKCETVLNDYINDRI